MKLENAKEKKKDKSITEKKKLKICFFKSGEVVMMQAWYEKAMWSSRGCCEIQNEL